MAQNYLIPTKVHNDLVAAAYRHRGYDEADCIVEADVVSGDDVESAIARFFARDDVRYIHVHNAKRGCFACKFERA